MIPYSQQSKNALDALRDLAEKRAFTARGIPWIGRKQLGSYSYYPAKEFAKGIRKLVGRVYRDTGGGWRVLNKPLSRRKRHRAEVAARKAGK